MADNNNNDDVFVYTEGAVVPSDVVSVRVHPSVTVIHDYTFQWRQKLERVELCDGLLEIGERAFGGCYALKSINISSTLVRIGDRAFEYVRVPIQLPDSIENIGHDAFAGIKIISKFRIPPLITTLREGTFNCCKSMFSLDLPESVIAIGSEAFSISLRNIALGMNYDGGIWNSRGPFRSCENLKDLFDTSSQMVYALKHRFDNLPIHKMIYYQSFNNMTLDELNNATDIRNSQWQTGRQQDCLGMTPLHILACSTTQDIELYRVLVNKYPEALVTEDRWSAVPILYAVWGSAPDEIVQFLKESCKTLYPNRQISWPQMVISLDQAEATQDVIRTFLSVSNQFEEWIRSFATYGNISYDTFRFLVQCGFTERVNAIGLRQWRDDITVETNKTVHDHYSTKNTWLDGIESKLSQYEAEYHRLKEATTLLELALWRIKMNDHEGKERQNKKMKTEDSDLREQCRMSCESDIVIQHVLPYLLPNKKFKIVRGGVEALRKYVEEIEG